MPLDQSLIPNLVALYQRGLLVPFIGSGMSRPTCTDWLTFLLRLARIAKMDAEVAQLKREQDKPQEEAPDYGLRYRIADRIVHQMHSLTPSEKAQRLRVGIQGWDDSVRAAIPENLTALTDGLLWPLVITTNYDDLYWAACVEQKQVPEIIGRGIADCHTILRSLDHITAPMCWALQGL